MSNSSRRRKKSGLRSLSGLAVALFAWLAVAGQSSPLQHFEENVTHYLSVTHDLRDRIQPSRSVHQIHEQRLQLANGIRSARTGAKQGQIFTPDVAAMFTQLMATTLDGPQGKRIRTSLRHAEPVADIALTIDAKYPDNVPLQSTPPSLLLNLPRLPRGMEYRIVGSSLVLRDEDADTVIDYLPGALSSGSGSPR